MNYKDNPILSTEECQKHNEMVYEPISKRDEDFLTAALRAKFEGTLDQFIAEYEKNKKPYVKTAEDIRSERRCEELVKEFNQLMRR